MHAHDQHGHDAHGSQPSSHGYDPAGHNHGHDHGGTGKYIVVFILLCVLTTASILTTMPWWRNNVPDTVSWAIMMTVSCAKALLVILFFMHLIWEASWKWVLTIPAACMSLFLVLMLIPDIGLRTRRYDTQRWSSAAYPAPTVVAKDPHHEQADHTEKEPADDHAH